MLERIAEGLGSFGRSGYSAPCPMMIVLFYLVTMLNASAIVLPCTMADMTLLARNYVSNTSCPTAIFENIIIQNNTMVNASLAGMVLANTLVNASISFTNVTLLDGSSLVMDEGISVSAPSRITSLAEPGAAHGNVWLNFSSLPTRMMIAKLWNFQLQNGAIISINRSSGVTTTATTQLRILVQSLLGRNGALVLSGTFPAGTSIVVRDANLTLDNQSLAVKISAADSQFPNYAKMIVVAGLNLVNQSSLSIVSSEVQVSTPMDCIGIYVMGDVTIGNGSLLAIVNSTVNSSSASYSGFSYFVSSASVSISGGSRWIFDSSIFSAQGNAFAFDVTLSSVSISAYSVWNFSSCTFVTNASGTTTFLIETSSLNITDDSLWLLERTRVVASRLALNIDQTPILVNSSSSWSLSNVQIELTGTSQSNAAFWLNMSPVNISGNSSWKLSSSTFTTGANMAWSIDTSPVTIWSNSSWTLSSLSIVGSRYSLFISASPVTLTDHCGWSINQCTTVSPASVSLSHLRVSANSFWVIQGSNLTSLFLLQSPVLVTGSSGWVVMNSSFVSQSSSSWVSSSSLIRVSSLSYWRVFRNVFSGPSTQAPLFLDGASLFQVENTSWVLWASNNMTSLGNDTCVVFQASINIASGGYMSVVDNNCTSTGWMWRNASGQATAFGGSGQMFKRCNRQYGTGLSSGFPLTAVSAGACETCNASADCFAFFTIPTSSCSTDLSGNAVCSCLPGGTSDLCLPVTYANFSSADWCVFVNMSIGPFNLTVGPACSSVVLLNVVARGSMTINVSISSMLLAGNVTAQLSNVTLLGGATLIIDSSGLSQLQFTRPSNLQISIQSLTSNNGALVFIGAFPPNTTILVSGINMFSDVMSRAPLLLIPDWLNPTTAVCLMFVGFALTRNSSILLWNSSVVVDRSSSGYAIYFIMNMSIASGSSFGVNGSYISSGGGVSVYVYHSSILLTSESSLFVVGSTVSSFSQPAFLFHFSPINITWRSSWYFQSSTTYSSAAGVSAVKLLSSPVTVFEESKWSFLSTTCYGLWAIFSNVDISSGSSFVISSSTVTSSGSYTLYFLNSRLSVINRSSWSVMSSTVSSTFGNIYHALFFSASPVAVANASVWSFTSSTVSSFGNAVLMSTSPVSLDFSSQWSFDSCLISSISSGTLFISNSRITISHSSSWLMRSSTVSSTAPLGSLGHVISFSGSSMKLSGSSMWLLTRCLIQSTASDMSPIVIDATSPVAIENASWILWASNNMSSAMDTCVLFQSAMDAAAGGYMSVVENTCTSTSMLWRNGSGQSSSVTNGSMYERCNWLNGTVLGAALLGLPVGSVTAGSCRTCNVNVDCYAPLTVPSSTCIVNSATSGTTATCMCSLGGTGDLCLPDVAQAGSGQCSFVNITLISPLNFTIDFSCTTVLFANVVVQRAMLINISIAGIVQSNSGVAVVTVSISNTTLQDGAVLVIAGNEVAEMEGSHGFGAESVSVKIQSLVGVNGALAFVGSFPPKTIITVTGANMISNNPTTAPTLASYDNFTVGYVKQLFFKNVLLRNCSSLVIRHAELNITSTASFPLSSPPICFTGSLTVSLSSILSLINVTIRSSSAALLMTRSVVSISENSEWKLINCSFESKVAAMLTSFSFITVASSSNWTIAGCTIFSTNGSALSLVQVQIIITNLSAWTMRLSSFSSGTSNGFASSSADVTVSLSSVVAFFQCTLYSPAGTSLVLGGLNIDLRSVWSLSTSNITAGINTLQTFGLVILSAAVFVNARSGIVIDSNTFTCSGPTYGSPFGFINSTISISVYSYWLLTGNVLHSAALQAGSASALILDSQSRMDVANSSWVLWRSNNMTSRGGSDTCVLFQASINIASGGYMSVVDNNCTSTGWMWRNASGQATAFGGSGQMFERCNRLNGTVLTTGGGLPLTAASAGACGTCNASADCFTPLTDITAGCSMNSSAGPATCTCTSGGSTDDMCLTADSPSPVAPPQADKCTFISVTLPQTNLTLSVSCVAIVIIDVVALGSSVVNISIAGIMIANPSAPNITISIQNLTMLDGAVLFIDSSNPPNLRNPPVVSILIRSLSSHNGAVGFSGLFPPSTSILVRDVHMLSDDTTMAPKLAVLDLVLGQVAKVIMLARVGLQQNSSFVIMRSSFVGRLIVPFFASGSLALMNSSSLVFADTLFDGTAGSMTVALIGIDILVAGGSEWSFYNCTLTGQGAGLKLTGSRVTVVGSSSWLFSECFIYSSSGIALHIGSLTELVLANQSSFDFTLCNVTSLGYAFHVLGSSVRAMNESYWSFHLCSFQSASAVHVFYLLNATIEISFQSWWSLTATNISGPAAFRVASSLIRIARTSSWSFKSCLIFSLHLELSSYVSVESSRWLLTETVFEATSPVIAAFLIRSSVVAVSNESVWSFKSCAITSSSSSALSSFFATLSILNIVNRSLWQMELCSISINSSLLTSSGPTFAFTLNSSNVLLVSRSGLTMTRNTVLQGLEVTMGSSLVLGKGSFWVFADNIVVGELPFMFGYASALLLAGNASWVLWASNDMTSLGNDTCVLFQGSINIAGGGYMSVVDNNCTSTGWMWRNASGQATAFGGSGQMFERCNRLNGTVLTTGGGLPLTAASAGLCGTCNASADCFTPLTASNSFCSVDTWTRKPSCDCLPGGSAVDRCLASAGDPCTFINVLLPVDDMTIDESCTRVIFQDVTAQGNMTVTLDISRMAQANPNIACVVVNISNVTLLDGAALVFNSSLSVSMDMPSAPVLILIESLAASSGGLAFVGRFPANTSILVKDATMFSNDPTAAPSFLKIDALTPSLPKILLLVNFTLQESSTFLVQRSTLDGTGVTPFYAVGYLTVANLSTLRLEHVVLRGTNASAIEVNTAPISISNRSSWSIESCDMTSSGAAIWLLSSPASVSLNSTWSIGRCSLRSFAFSSFLLTSSPIVVSRYSSWSLETCTIVAHLYSFLAAGASILIEHQSSWTCTSCNLSTANLYAFYLSSTQVAVVNSSTWVFSDCNITATANSYRLVLSPVVVSEQSSWSFTSTRILSFQVYLSSITVANESQWIFEQCELLANSGVAAFVVRNSTITFSNQSAWAFASVTFASLFNVFYVIFSEVRMASRSRWTIQNCDLSPSRASINSAFLVSDSTISILDESGWSVTGNVIVCVKSQNYSDTSSIYFESNSTLLVAQGSYWILAANTLTSCSTSAPQIAIDSVAKIFIGNTSWVLWRSNNMTSRGGSDTCVLFQGSINIASGGYMSVVDNNCTSSGWMWRNASGQATAFGGSGQMFERCNRLNGTVLTTGGGLPLTAVSAGACGTCNASADCFTPLTDITAGCSMNSAGTATCTCTSGGSTDDMCLPAELPLLFPSTAAPNGTCPVVSAVTSYMLLAGSNSSSQFPSGSTLSVTEILSSGNAVIYFMLSDRFGSTTPLMNFTMVTTTIGVVTVVHAPNASLPASSASAIVVTVNFGSVTINSLPASSLTTLTVEIRGVHVTGDDCTSAIFSNGSAPGSLIFSCYLQGPLKVVQNPALKKAVQTTFRSTTTVSGLLMNPVTAMSNTGMISILSLQQCVFSDVDPLDPSMSPLGVGYGMTSGQYYRGAVIAGLALYSCGVALCLLIAIALRFAFGKHDGFSTLRFPSILLIAVSLLHQGVVMSSTSLIRLNADSSDVGIGVAGIIVGALVTIGVLLATTLRLSCRIERRRDVESLAYEAKIPGLHFFLSVAMWDSHWVDGDVAGYKKRNILLLDDLRLPWWTAIELSSGIAQGIILGVRRSETSVCQQQLIALVIHCIVMFSAVCFLRPCGSVLGNVFLIASKLGGLLVAAIELDYIDTFDDSVLGAADVITAIFMFLSAAQTAYQVVLLIVTASRRFVPGLQKQKPIFVSGPVLEPFRDGALVVPLLEGSSSDRIMKDDGLRESGSEEELGTVDSIVPSSAPEQVGNETLADPFSGLLSGRRPAQDPLAESQTSGDSGLPEWGRREFLLEDIVRGLTDQQAWRGHQKQLAPFAKSEKGS